VGLHVLPCRRALAIDGCSTRSDRSERIYTAAHDLFRVRLVSTAVDRKLAIIRDSCAALYEEASGGRAAAMEFAVVLLIAVEITLALLRY
jgi:uncharacterized Rmd1/YagE family protein